MTAPEQPSISANPAEEPAVEAELAVGLQLSIQAC